MQYRFENNVYSFSFVDTGCLLTSLCVPDRDGNIRNILLSYPEVEKNPEVVKQDGYFGMIVGRFANRISNASFSLNGEKYSFTANNNENLLHSGEGSLCYRKWNVKKIENGFSCYIKVSQEDDGFPGTMEIFVTYTLTCTGVFSIHYKAICDKDCPLNITNHAYFNLTGDMNNSIDYHEFTFNSSKYVEVDDKLIPTGRIKDVDGTPFDFRKPSNVTCDIDHCFVIDRKDGESRGFTRFAHVYEKTSGIIMTAYTDLPGFQFYTGNFLPQTALHCKPHTGFCLETEFYPDCVNISSFPSCVLKAGDVYESSTDFCFYTDGGSK